MKTQKLMLKALGAIAAAAAVSVGCTGLEPYEIDTPDDLEQLIQEYQEEKQAGQSDDYTEIDLTATLVGAEDNSSGWWTEFSQYFTVPSGKKLFLEFENYGTGENNWNNWNVCVANGERDGSDYSEYFVLRSDWYGWGNSDYNSAMISFDYNGGDVDWDDFKVKMNGAYVTMSLDHAKAGAAYLEVKSVKDDFVITETYNQPVSATADVNVFLICDGSHFLMKKAYLVPSEIQEIPDEDAVSISMTGFPAATEVGTTLEEALEGCDIKGTVTFADNSTAEVSLADVTVTDPTGSFGTAEGTYTILYSYSKTKQGNYGPSVAGMTSILVTKPVAGIEATATAYLIGEAKYVTLSPANVQVKCKYDDGSEGLLKTGQYELSFTDGKVLYEGVSGTYENAFTAKFVSATGAEYTSDGTLTIAASALEAQTGIVGAEDFSNGWWTAFTQDWVVAPGESQSVSFTLYSDNLGNWHSPCTILRKADLSEYTVVRMDNYGWGASYPSADYVASDWNWDTFMTNLNGSKVTITVANSGDGWASVRYHVISADETEHYQWYDYIAVDSDDLQFALVTEESYLEFTTPEPSEVTLVSMEVTTQPTTATYYYYDNTSLAFRTGGLVVTGTYSDATTATIPVSKLKFSDITVTEGAQNVTITSTEDETITTTVGITLVKGAYGVGAADCTGAFWSAFAGADKAVASGSSVSFEMDVYSSCANNWNGPVAVLRKADTTLGADGEYGVVRIDNFGWGAGFANIDDNKASDWNWDLFLSMLTNAHVKITATNNGDDTASIRYDVVWANGEKHYQEYKNIAIDSADAQLGVTIDGCYLVIVE